MSNVDPLGSTATKTRRHRRQAARRLAGPTVTAAMVAGALIAGGVGQADQVALLSAVGQSRPTVSTAASVQSDEMPSLATHFTALHVLGLIPSQPAPGLSSARTATPAATPSSLASSQALTARSAQSTGLAALLYLLEHDPKPTHHGAATTAALSRVVNPSLGAAAVPPSYPISDLISGLISVFISNGADAAADCTGDACNGGNAGLLFGSGGAGANGGTGGNAGLWG
ncbi:MAG: hypothetical protein M3O28_00225, partial [Actinomycetota bacterium]|nr:hypothetical protein [Actinomycetota bacterium]